MSERVPTGEPTRVWQLTHNPIYRILVEVVLVPFGLAISVTSLLGFSKGRSAALLQVGIFVGFNLLMLVVPRLRPPLREDPDEPEPLSLAWVLVAVVSMAAVVAFLLAVVPN